MSKARKGFVGIDPGLTGAVAMIVDGKFADAFPMPITQTRTGRNQVDVRELAARFEDLAIRAEEIDCIVEQVASRPGQGATTTFSLGDSFGSARAIATIYCHRVQYVHPAVWKRHLKLTKDKQYSLTRARESFPVARPLLTRKKDEGVAEAILLASYGRTLHLW